MKLDGPVQHLSIGAVAKLTQIPAHTLRKWESRHGIGVPERSETGRRVYTQEHVEQLRLVKKLLGDGHSLAHLAGLSTEQLLELASLHQAEPAREAVAQLVLVGPNVARLLTAQSIPALRVTGAVEHWLAAQPDVDAESGVVVECETLPQPLASALLELKQRVASVVVVYAYASSRTVNELVDAGVKAIQGPVRDDELLLYLEIGSAPPPSEDARQQRFSVDELARIAALNPGLQCECPNHIARLLMEIGAFEKYSRECVDTDPDERALHAQLGEISARARELFEDALIAVASADGIALSIHDQR